MKHCPACGDPRPLDEFHVDRRTRDGRRSDCKRCCRRRVQTFRSANRERLLDEKQRHRGDHWRDYRDREVRKKYGISWEQYLAWQARGRCDVCGSTTTRDRWGRFHLDHDHASGKIRGLLCGPCNTGIGQFQDDPQRLRAAAQYLEAFRANVGVTPARNARRTT